MSGSNYAENQGRLWQTWVSGAIAVLLGAAVMIAIYGFAPLDPRDQGWLWAGLSVDPIQFWLGWTYFRHSPWTMPPGANPDFGMELATAIYFADAVPLLAMPLKALHGVLDVPQYVGPWLLTCGALQGLFGWRLVGLATRDPLSRACGAGLLALQPMLMHRMTGHTALAGQWTLLAALFLALGPARGGRSGVAWVALLAATALIHSYLLAMGTALWIADWTRRTWIEPHGRGWRGPSLELAAVPGSVVAALWAGGFFLLRGGYDLAPAVTSVATAPGGSTCWRSSTPGTGLLSSPTCRTLVIGKDLAAIISAWAVCCCWPRAPWPSRCARRHCRVASCR